MSQAIGGKPQHQTLVHYEDSRSRYHFQIFYHPFVCAFIKALNARGVDGLLKWTVQKGVETSVQRQENDFFDADYAPTDNVLDYQIETVDFSPDGAYSQYNWELFFHAPLLIATRLSANQRFEEAQKWFHYIFDPTDGSIQKGTQRFWKVLPFWHFAQNPPENELKDLLNPDPNDAAAMQTAKNLSQDVEAWRLNPFEPHLVARQRQWSYPKAVVMKYIDNLIAWGDQLFRQNTLETINEATLLYILAADILGPRPVEIQPQVVPKATTYKDLTSKFKLEDFSDALVASENLAFALNQNQNGQGNGQQPNPPDTLEFCIPKNDQLLGYWDTVADRLFKIRRCMNIEGVVQQLPLFEPPIDVGALVRAAAAGVDISSVLNDLYAPLPHYRFGTMLQKALEICGDVKALGSALLSALEKRDAEAISLLRSGQEIDMLAAVRLVKQNQIDEANRTLEGLTKYREVVNTRYTYYSSRVKISDKEQAYLGFADTAYNLQEGQAMLEGAAAVLHLLPDVKSGSLSTLGLTYGGSNIAPALQSFGGVLGADASAKNTQGSMSAASAGYDRRWDDWLLQANLAGGKDGKGGELAQIDKQIAAADIRRQIAELELANHDKQTDNSKAVDEFMRNKFTNEELFDWMVSQTSSVYFQTYQMAYDLAKRAEKGFQFELGDPQASFIKFGDWDTRKNGLHAGERLHYDLRRMELAHLDQNKREYEITKHISLVLLNPMALIVLKETGQCIVDLPEALFDMDYPGHYLRRVKSVSLTIPCVTGPYTSVNCTLTPLKSKIRIDSDAQAPYPETDDDKRFAYNFAAMQSIATSHAQNDSGMFELNFRDERYLPFEGAGAISTWRIDMPKENNAFDFETISDLVLNLNYTARDGGASLKTAAAQSVQLPAPPQQATSQAQPDFVYQPNLLRLFSLKHEFPNDWYRFLNPPDIADQQTMTINLTMGRFPFQFRGRTIQIQQVELFLKFRDTYAQGDGTPLGDYAKGPAALTLNMTPPNDSSTPAPLISDPSFLNGLPYKRIDLAGSLGAWLLEAKSDDVKNIAASLQTGVPINNPTHYRIKPEVIQDIIMVCHYSVA